MELSEGIAKINADLCRHAEGPLGEAQVVMVTAAWLDQSYEEAAEGSDFSFTYLQKHVGPQLWSVLSVLYGKKVNLKRLKRIVESHASKAFQTQKVQLLETPGSTKAKLLGNSLPVNNDFYGRKPELASLSVSISDVQCLLLIGQAGIGKSSLVAKLVEQMRYDSESPEIFIWKPLFDPPNLTDLIPDLLTLLDVTPEQALERQVQQLIEEFRRHRILLILDGVERLLEGNPPENPYGDYGDYEWFVRTMTTEPHKSCLLLTSREPLSIVSWLNETGQSARIIRLEGLSKDARNILRVAKLTDRDEWGTLIQVYRGNPLSLKMVASQISKFFNGKVSLFLECKTTWMGEPFKEALDTQFRSGLWTELEYRLLQFLAEELKESEEISFSKLLQTFTSSGQTQSITELMKTIEVLCDRSLLERNSTNKGDVQLSLSPVIKKYILTDPSGLIHKSLAA